MGWEVAHRLNKAKVPSDLITGQEREEVDGAKHKSVTVEMVDVKIYLYSRIGEGELSDNGVKVDLWAGLCEILEHFVENAKLSSKYFIFDCEEMLKVATVIDELPLSLNDKYIFAISPVEMVDDISSQGLTRFAQSYSKTRYVRLQEKFTPGTLKVPKTT